MGWQRVEVPVGVEPGVGPLRQRLRQARRACAPSSPTSAARCCGREELLITRRGCRRVGGRHQGRVRIARTGPVDPGRCSMTSGHPSSRNPRGRTLEAGTLQDVNPRIHPTAEIEPGVEIGGGHGDLEPRARPRTGAHRFRLHRRREDLHRVRCRRSATGSSSTHSCTCATPCYIEDGVMVGAGAVFTNDRFPRATTPDLRTLRDSGPGETIEPTYVARGGDGRRRLRDRSRSRDRTVRDGRHGVDGDRDVPPFHLVVGSPATTIAYVCRCGTAVPAHRGRSAQASVAGTGRARLAVCSTASTTAASPSAAHRDHIEPARSRRHDRHCGALGRGRGRHARAHARAPARAARPRGDGPRSAPIGSAGSRVRGPSATSPGTATTT